jgi:hypothetical protein
MSRRDDEKRWESIIAKLKSIGEDSDAAFIESKRTRPRRVEYDRDLNETAHLVRLARVALQMRDYRGAHDEAATLDYFKNTGIVVQQLRKLLTDTDKDICRVMRKLRGAN